MICAAALLARICCCCYLAAAATVALPFLVEAAGLDILMLWLWSVALVRDGPAFLKLLEPGGSVGKVP